MNYKILERINNAGLLLQKIELTNDGLLKSIYRSEYEIEMQNIKFMQRMGKKFAHKVG